jgi:hypothetical protein
MGNKEQIFVPILPRLGINGLFAPAAGFYPVACAPGLLSGFHYVTHKLWDVNKLF